jgi:hypothetical protein
MLGSRKRLILKGVLHLGWTLEIGVALAVSLLKYKVITQGMMWVT